MDKNFYKFQLSFENDLAENGFDAFDVANTILATSQSLHQIAEIQYGAVSSTQLKININAFKEGSLLTDFVLFMGQTANLPTPLIALGPQIFEVGKTLLKSFKLYVDIKKALKGNPPSKVEVKGDGSVNIYAKDCTFNMDYVDFRVLQDKSLSRNMERTILPLIKETSLKKLNIIGEDVEKISISREEAIFLKEEESFQIIPKIKYKGVISKIDRKALSGYINLEERRLPFVYPKEIEQDKLNILIESLKTQIEIYLVGDVDMDYKSNPKSMTVTDVQTDERIF